MLVISLILIGVCAASAVSMAFSQQGTDSAKLKAIPGIFAALLLALQTIVSDPAGSLRDPGRIILVVACAGVIILLYLEAETKAAPDRSETTERVTWAIQRTISANDDPRLQCYQLTFGEESDFQRTDWLFGITTDQVKEASLASIAARAKISYNSSKLLNQDELETSGCWWVDRPLRTLHGFTINTRIRDVAPELKGMQLIVYYDVLRVTRSVDELQQRHPLLFEAILEFVYAHQFDEALNDLMLFGELGTSKSGYLFINVSSGEHLTRRQADAVAELIDRILGELKRQDSLVDFGRVNDYVDSLVWTNEKEMGGKANHGSTTAQQA